MVSIFYIKNDSSNISLLNNLNLSIQKFKKHTLVKTIVILIFLAIIPAFGSEAQNKLDLTGTWKFNIGDNPEWAKTDFNDKTWVEIRVGDEWENQGFQGYDGFAWYRVEVPIPLAKFSSDEDFYL